MEIKQKADETVKVLRWGDGATIQIWSDNEVQVALTLRDRRAMSAVSDELSIIASERP